MRFDGKEMTAIVALAKAMVLADGKIEENELKVIGNELARFGVPQNDCAAIFAAAEKLNIQDVLGTIAKMGNEEKKYVAAYLGTIIIADNDVDETELKLWRFISTICELPTMSIHDAVQFMVDL